MSKSYNEDSVLALIRRACKNRSAKSDYGSGRYIPQDIKNDMEGISTETGFSYKKIIAWAEEELDRTAK